MKWLMFVLGVFLLFSVGVVVDSHAGGRVVLAWDPNIETDLAGYKLYYKSGATDAPGGPVYDGTICDQGPSPISIPLSALDDPQDPQFEVTFPEIGPVKVYFALTAYDGEDPPLESTYSNEVYVYWPKDVEDGVAPLIPRQPDIESIERVLEITKIEKTIDKVIYGDNTRFVDAKNYFADK